MTTLVRDLTPIFAEADGTLRHRAVLEILMDVWNIANDRWKLAKEAEDYVVETCAENMSDEYVSAQAKAVVESKDNDGGVAGMDKIFPIKE